MDSSWLQWISAGFIIFMLIVLAPRAKQMLTNSPKAEAGDWQAFLLPIALVVGFIMFLIWMVRN